MNDKWSMVTSTTKWSGERLDDGINQGRFDYLCDNVMTMNNSESLTWKFNLSYEAYCIMRDHLKA